MNYLKDLTNEELKACLLVDMESLRDGGWVQHVEGHCPDDDSIDATVSVIEEVFRRIDVYSNKRKPHDRHALSNKLITNALKRGDIPRPQIDWQCDRGICEYSDRINGQCQCYNEDLKRGDV